MCRSGLGEDYGDFFEGVGEEGGGGGVEGAEGDVARGSDVMDGCVVDVACGGVAVCQAVGAPKGRHI